jgi:adenine-specific DNA-methyltransferase
MYTSDSIDRGDPGQSSSQICPKRRRSLGIYYTPSALSDAIAYWAVRNRTDTVLEPSFGGCGFLTAARRHLAELKVKKPGNQLAGCDIDQFAFVTLHSIGGKRASTSRYLKKDFLSIEPGDFPIEEFTCVLGNPPFVRHHEISPSVKRRIAKLTLRGSNPLPKTAGLWAHFVAHSLRFLARNGRLGLVLPSSFLFADYARPLRELIRKNFNRTTIIKLNYQTFYDEGAEQRAIVLLAEGFGVVGNLNWLELMTTSESDTTALIKAARMPRRRNRFVAHCAMRSQTAYEEMASDPHVKTFGEMAKVEIGVVTGDNKFFIFQKAKVQSAGLSDSLFTRIIGRAGHATGLIVQPHEFIALQESQVSCLLLTPSDIQERHTHLRRYLATMSREQRRTGVWLNKRAQWYRPDVGRFPDAALTYMNHHGPRLVLLDGSTTCSNTLHRIWLPNLDPTRRELIALSLLSTFSQLSAEIEGRSYGGGVLKIEPSDARRLKLYIPSELSPECVNRSFKQADSLLKLGQYDRAGEVADHLILGSQLRGSLLKVASRLRKELLEKRRERWSRRVTRENKTCHT